MKRQMSLIKKRNWEEGKVLQMRHTNGPQIHEKVLNITNHQGNANPDYMR